MSNEPEFNDSVVAELQEYILEQGDTDYALLHLSAAFAGLCSSLQEAETIAAFAYRIMRQKEDMTADNVIPFRR